MLDEIGEMPVGLQAKLLHVLQDREFTQLGSNRPVEVDVRVIAATNRDLTTMMRAGQFREDLYYRLQVIEIRVPPLRERREEIPALVEFFLRRYAERYGRPCCKPSPALLTALVAYAWPGNVRELENMMKRFVILRDEASCSRRLRERDRPIEPAAPAGRRRRHGGRPSPSRAPPARRPGAAPRRGRRGQCGAEAGKLPELARAAALSAEREAIQRALDHFRWNRRKAASSSASATRRCSTR